MMGEDSKRSVVTLPYQLALLCGLWALVCGANASLYSSQVKDGLPHCPHLDLQIHEDTSLRIKSYTEADAVLTNAANLNTCAQACCHNTSCHVALMQDQRCYNIHCKNIDMCKVIPQKDSSVVIVRRAPPHVGSSAENKAWTPHYRSAAQYKQSRKPKRASYLLSRNVRALKETTTATPVTYDIRCEVGLRECNKNEACIVLGSRNKNGLCKCVKNFHRDPTSGVCIRTNSTQTSTEGTLPNPVSPGSGKNLSAASTVTSPTPTVVLPTSTVAVSTPSHNDSTQKQVERLVVSINNKTVYLPAGTTFYEKRVTLSAYAIGGSDNLKFDWNLLEQPEGDDRGSISDSSSQTITLSHLRQGIYVFHVLVTDGGVEGGAVANVTVKPAKRINQPPKAIISSMTQPIKLPTSGVIIDGSGSTDDDGIESFHWEMVMVPLGYNPPDQTGPTLHLTDLIPGNYTIMLRVKDKEGLEGTAKTVVNVIKETDYPPTANAGGDKIVYLPQTETVLFGNTSTDDHGIEEWEWTKGPKDSGKAVDMQDTRTPFLRLSNLEEGHYQFILRVTDSIGQSSNTSVYVYVQKPNLSAPKANAGANIEIVLPNASITLDGSHSTDAAISTHWLWKQLSGPNTAQFSKVDVPQANVTGLTKGKYVFMLTVWNGDDPLKNTTDNVTVIVIHDKNRAPVASAGGDQSVKLPVSVVVVDGSKSTDDMAVARWLWERDPNSLAAGVVINDSNISPVLMFSDVVAGRYVWKLTVWDDQGASSSDTVSIIVEEGKHHLDEVEVVVGGDIGSLGYSQLTTLLQKLELLLHTAHTSATTHLIALRGRPHSGQVSVTFLVTAGDEVVKGTEVVSVLRHHVSSSDLLDLPFLSVDTVVCQNNCSGHGECVAATRDCRCHTWWMESFTRRHMGDGWQNCDWSVVYVFVTLCLTVITTGLVVWGAAALIFTKLKGTSRPHRKPLRYSLLGSHDDTSAKIKTRPPGSLLDSATESESDAEILFDSRKMNAKHRGEKQRNGYPKMSRIHT